MTGIAPPSAFFDELGAAFRRLRPQGTTRWNFAVAYDALDRMARRLGRPAVTPASDATADPGPLPGSVRVRRQAKAVVEATLGPWVGARATAAATVAAADVVDGLRADAGEGLHAAAEAFRYLAVRVDQLERRLAQQRSPVDGLAWIVAPPDLSAWAGQVSGWLAGAAGEVVVGECGTGDLALALIGSGLAVRGVEPRADAATTAARRGVDVQVAPVADVVASYGAGALAGAVLTGTVDREPLPDVLDLLTLVADRLSRGAPLVVLGSSPATWDEVALDLLPGRPLHAATWAFLLRRAGFGDVEVVTRAASYGVAARR